MSLLLFGLIVFIGSHSIGMIPNLKSGLKSKFGEQGYRILYSLISAIGLVLLVYGFGHYRATGWIEVWTPPAGLRHLNLVFMLFAFIALVSVYMPRGHIKSRLKHPMLVAVKAWALGHLLANGDLGSMIMFGALLAWAVVNRISFRWRSDEQIASGNPNVVGDVLAVLVGLGLYGVVLHFHETLFGVAVFG